tara:strand:- start:468 stop:1055 length:588 start_codon:yes stop_codon:yes gene_type:complete
MISEYYNSLGIKPESGYSDEISDNTNFLQNIVNDENIKSVLEIGFHWGHSSDTFLRSNKEAMVTSFDIGHPNISLGREYLSKKYGERHTLIIGNSKESIPQFISSNPDVKFDLIFIDGGHLYDVVKSDMENCMKLAHENSILILDDVIFDKRYEASWTRDPTKVWNEFLSNNRIVQDGYKFFRGGRGLVWGKYIL